MIKSFLVLSGVLVFLTGCVTQDAQKDVMPKMSSDVINISISPKIFAQKIEDDSYTVLDVRTPEEYVQERITIDATNINFYDADFREQLNALPKDQKYLLYCRSGNRSGKTLKMMKEFGFKNVEELSGGIGAWKNANLPVVK